MSAIALDSSQRTAASPLRRSSLERALRRSLSAWRYAGCLPGWSANAGVTADPSTSDVASSIFKSSFMCGSSNVVVAANAPARSVDSSTWRMTRWRADLARQFALDRGISPRDGGDRVTESESRTNAKPGLDRAEGVPDAKCTERYWKLTAPGKKCFAVPSVDVRLKLAVPCVAVPLFLM